MRIHDTAIRASLLLAFGLAAFAMPADPEGVQAAERTVKIGGFGALSGPLRSFGINTQAVMKAAVDDINTSGGVKLGDGSMAKIELTFDDSACNAEQAISVVRRLASSDTVVGVGPTYSGGAKALFGTLQKKVGDSSDSGLQFPIFTDTAIKKGLAKISDWSFRNVPNEDEIYQVLFGWIKSSDPSLKTVFGGVETNQAHSNATWGKIMKVRAEQAGYAVAGQTEWLMTDTSFSTQVREMRKANANIVAISSHPFTTCGVLKEMARQRVRPKVLVGLTSSSSMETLKGCAKQAEGIVIPTSFAPVNDAAQKVASAADRFGGSADLHSAAAWEIIHVLKTVMESEGIMAKPETVQEDRIKIRNGLAKVTETQGLLGKITRTPEGEALKPYLFVQAKGGDWSVVHNPGN